MMWFAQLLRPAGLIIGDSSWLVPAVIIGGAGVVLTLLLNRRRLASMGVASALRVTGWLLIAACLANPLWSSARPRQGVNVFAVLVDTSRSQSVTDTEGHSRADMLGELLEEGERTESHGWLHRIDEYFELRRYTIADHLQRTPHFHAVRFDGASSRLESGLQQLAERFQDQPLAAILMLTDGNATDRSTSLKELSGLPPVYPVVPENKSLPPDVAIQAVSVSQSAFDDAPVTVQVHLRTDDVTNKSVRTTLLDREGTPIESQTRASDDDSPVRLHVRPKSAGTVFYRVRSEILDENSSPVEEATHVNNTRLVAVDRGSKPRRVLYVSGRPNWEFKFLRRAVETDPQTELVGLIRIARREAKFEFRGHSGERSNSLFRGFEEAEQEVAEEYDEPVLVRLGTRDDDELISGFPEEAADLFRYDALILDDIEAGFFTADQQLLIRDFVSRRGGGLLMLGGQESFRRGEYDRTPVGEMLPVDLHRPAETASGPLRLNLTREGWLQPWVRLRSDEEAEHTRLQSMPTFRTLNPAARIRPGAQVMASVLDESGQSWPALVIQRFGRGRSAALCIGDLWRWRLHEGLRQQRRPRSNSSSQNSAAPWDQSPEEDRGDFAMATRQMIRWLVSDVPQRLAVTSAAAPDTGVHSWRLSARVRGREFEAREDARVTFEVTRPNGTQLQIVARAADDEVGRFDAVIPASEPGAWQCEVTATLEDPESDPEELTAQHGWACQPDQQEMASVNLNTAWLAAVAEQTGGRLVNVDELDSFVDQLQTAERWGADTVMEVLSWPVWHQWTVFLVALGCFMGDWTIRRRLGYP